ncbi:zf-HC2 domain-containing protein [Paenibacillus jiagnxiensis]|uniref:zf-HC2 domain-containing protein n=1 Tax=Paenibacillus jiagnxiensis TaxID=3228926 RepID=UPI0033A93B53
MKCEEVMDLMQRYVDHDLDELETFELLDHVAECPACAEKFQILQALSRDLEELPAVTPKYSLVDAILPQLDAIDEARREQGSALQEMKPVTLQGAPGRQRQSEPLPWWKRAAGRAALGVAAAAAVLGVVAITYEPKAVENAEMQMMEENTGSEANTHNASGGEEAASEPEQEQTDSAVDSRTGAEPTQDKSASSGTPVTEEITPEVQDSKSDHAASDEPAPSITKEEKPAEKADSSTDSKAESQKKPPADDAGSAEENNATSEDASSKPAAEKAPKAEEAPKAEQAPKAGDSQTEQEPEFQTFIASSKESGQPADDGSQDTTAQGAENSTGLDSTLQEEKLAPADDQSLLKNRVQNDTSGDASSMAITTQPGNNDAFTPKTSERPATESPDGQYIVEVEGKKLTVYKQSEDGAEKIAMEVRTLNGTWVGGSWSEDSKTFTYSTEQDGTVSNYIYTVPQVTK